MKIVFWVVVLIAIYLFVMNATKLTGIINNLGSVTLKGIATLQGRDAVGVTK